MTKPIGISPMNDMAFKKAFGSPGNEIALISLLNAILKLLLPIVAVRIMNPYNLQDFESDKLSILDIKATDRTGATYHIEMQLTPFNGLVQRIVFYGCELYAGQLKAGDDYTKLAPVYSICIVAGILWKELKKGENAQKVHQRFRLCDLETGLVLDDTLQIHTLELGRYNLTESELKTASAEDCWLYWFLYADQYGPEELLKLFPEEAFQTATRAIIQIAEKTEDKAMYDAREKANRDFQTAISSAHQEGEVKGRQEGEVKGRQEGRQEGRQVGRQEGTLIGRVETFQELLGITEPTREELSNFDIPQLTELADRLQRQLRSRGN